MKDMQNRYGFGKEVRMGFDEAITRVVEFLDPGMMGQMTDNKDVATLGEEVQQKLHRVMDAL